LFAGDVEWLATDLEKMDSLFIDTKAVLAPKMKEESQVQVQAKLEHAW
jgi:hypothetical protein